jgi:hypothetical protein
VLVTVGLLEDEIFQLSKMRDTKHFERSVVCESGSDKIAPPTRLP